MDFGEMAVAAGLGLVEKLLFSWFEAGEPHRVKQAELERRIDELSKKEALKSSLDERTIRSSAVRVLEDLVRTSPELAFEDYKLRGRHLVIVDQTAAGISANKLLADLKARLEDIAARNPEDYAGPSTAATVIDIPQYRVFEPGEIRSESGAGARSKERRMQSAAERLADLTQRVEERESRRE